MRDREVFAVGVDIGGTAIKAGLVSTEGRLVRSLSAPTEGGRRGVLTAVFRLVEELLDGPGGEVGRAKVVGIGADSPGLVDDAGRVVTGASNIPGWNGTALGAELRRRFRLPVRVENDVTALVLGESLFGNGRPYRFLLGLAFGTGLGGGIVIDHKVYRGRTGYAAEFGHMVVDTSPQAAVCTCGSRGCWEAYASRVGIQRMLREVLPGHPGSCLRPEATPKEVYEAARRGDRAAKAVVAAVGEKVGAGIASLVNIFDPDAVMVGGGIAEAGKIFFDAFLPAYRRWVLPYHRRRGVRFIRPKFGAEGGVVGAASLILQEHLGERR